MTQPLAAGCLTPRPTASPKICNLMWLAVKLGIISRLIWLLPLLSSTVFSQDVPVPDNRAAWMPVARWGVMNHYLADWIARTTHEPMSVERWNLLVDHFDVEALA